MFSPAKAIAAGALVFALGGVLLIAQPFDQQGDGVPGAEGDSERATPVRVTGNVILGHCPETATVQVVGGVEQERGGYCDMRWRTSDPRIDGPVKWSGNQDSYLDGSELGIGFMTWFLENEEGAWRSRPVATIEFPDAGAEEDGLVTILDGEGAYVGLTAVLVVREDSGSGAITLDGFIIDGDFPPPPEFASTE